MVGRMAPLRPIDDKVGERLEADADVRRVFEDFRALPLFLANTRARKHSTIFADEPRWRRYVTHRTRGEGVPVKQWARFSSRTFSIVSSHSSTNRKPN